MYAPVPFRKHGQLNALVAILTKQTQAGVRLHTNTSSSADAQSLPAAPLGKAMPVNGQLQLLIRAFIYCMGMSKQII